MNNNPAQRGLQCFACGRPLGSDESPADWTVTGVGTLNWCPAHRIGDGEGFDAWVARCRALGVAVPWGAHREAGDARNASRRGEKRARGNLRAALTVISGGGFDHQADHQVATPKRRFAVLSGTPRNTKPGARG